jgi:hypothetical protein
VDKRSLLEISKLYSKRSLRERIKETMGVWRLLFLAWALTKWQSTKEERESQAIFIITHKYRSYKRNLSEELTILKTSFLRKTTKQPS